MIDDDGLHLYDPATDGIDFYESLEGMLVTVDAPLVVASTTSFGETYVVASGGAGATGINARGGITISDGDLNPERIQIDDTDALFAGYDPDTPGRPARRRHRDPDLRLRPATRCWSPRR